MGPRRSWSKDKRSRAHDVLDMKGNKAADQVRGIIEAMHATELRLPSHDNDSRSLIREGGNRRRHVQMHIRTKVGLYIRTLGPLAHAHDSRCEFEGGAGRSTVAVNLAVALHRAGHRVLVVHFREHAKELLEHGMAMTAEAALGLAAH